MKNLTIIALFVFCVQQISSQEVCAPKEETFIDVNVLDSKKCTISENKPQKKSSKDLLISSKRYLKKRVYLNKIVYSASSLESKDVLNTSTVNRIDDELLAILLKKTKAEEVSFDIVEKIPLFVSCDKNDMDNVNCFNYEMQKHIINNFNYPKKALRKGIEGVLEVSFIIGVDGDVSNVVVKGANESDVLKEEAKRIVSLLPRFVPGEHKGRKIPVSYKFPMNFTLD